MNNRDNQVSMAYRKSILLEDLLEWTLSILLILELNTVFAKSYNINFHISELIVALTIILFFFCIKRVRRNTIIFVGLYEIYACILLLASVSNASMINYTIKFMVFLPLMMLLYDTKQELAINIIKKMSCFVVFLAITSVIMYVLSYFIPPFGTFNILWGWVAARENYIFFFAGQFQEIAGSHFLRNTGIFVEAPMFAFTLVMALSTQLFFYEKVNKKNIFSLVAACVTALSVTAIIMSMALIVLKLYFGDLTNSKEKQRKFPAKKRLVKYLLVILGIIAFMYVGSKLYRFKLTTGLSYTKRIDDYAAAFNAWRTNPLFGIGYGNGENIINYMADWRLKYSTPGFSNAVMLVFATMGIYGSFIYVLAFERGIRRNFKNNKYLAIQFCVLLALLCVTVLPMQLYILQYLALGIVGIKANKK